MVAVRRRCSLRSVAGGGDSGTEEDRVDKDFLLRDVLESDLPIFFAHQSDADARRMAAFVSRDSGDQAAFMAHWRRILADPTNVIRAIVVDGEVAGSVSSYQSEGHPEVTYWIGKEHWGKGLATRALARFLAHADPTRPIHARAAKDNVGSLRVLEKCGFTIVGEDTGFANARGGEIEELILRLQ
jgi:RimJ/RimL family protein N-acetyltransferase